MNLRSELPPVSVASVKCPITTVSAAREYQGRDSYEICLVRAGGFTYRDHRGSAFVDPLTCLLAPPGGVVEMGHPAPGGDFDTFVHLSPAVWHMIAPEAVVPLIAEVTGGIEVTHRRLLAAVHDADAMLIEEHAVTLVAAAMTQTLPAPTSAARPRTDAARRRIVEDARTLLGLDPTADSIVDLARRIGTSPHHLSRVFHAATGMTLSAYRTRLRLHRAIEMLTDSAQDPHIADIAAATGFADQAHLARVFRRHLGTTPTDLRNGLLRRGHHAHHEPETD